MYEAVGAYTAGRITEAELRDVEDHACPGAGACGGQFTANTMATAYQMLGISPMGTNDIPAGHADKAAAALACGRLAVDLVRQGLTPRAIVTRESFENAIRRDGDGRLQQRGAAPPRHRLGVRHPARPRRFRPHLAPHPDHRRHAPVGPLHRPEMHAAGGMAVVGKRLMEAGLLHPEARTVTGLSLGDEIARAPEPAGQTVIRPVTDPFKSEGGLVVLRGNLAPGGAVMKVSGQTKRLHRGPAKVFEREEDAFAAIRDGRIVPNDVMVLRNEGPRGGPGMREMQLVTGALQGSGLGEHVALMTDGPLLRCDRGFVIGHVVPEAFEGGPIAAIRDGDTVTIDVDARRLDVALSDDEIARRRAGRPAPGRPIPAACWENTPASSPMRRGARSPIGTRGLSDRHRHSPLCVVPGPRKRSPE